MLKLKKAYFLLNFFLNLKFYIVLKKSDVAKVNNYFLIGFKEKYKLLNLQVIYENLHRVQKFINWINLTNCSFCFVSFDKSYTFLTKRLATFTRSSYIVGSWLNGFFSRNMFKQLLKLRAGKNSLETDVTQFKTPVFILISSKKSEPFLHESCNLNLPYIILGDLQKSLSFFSYQVACDTSSLESVFFFCRVLVYYVISVGKKTKKVNVFSRGL